MASNEINLEKYILRYRIITTYEVLLFFVSKHVLVLAFVSCSPKFPQNKTIYILATQNTSSNIHTITNEAYKQIKLLFRYFVTFIIMLDTFLVFKHFISFFRHGGVSKMEKGRSISYWRSAETT